jgi:hypothetical protein
MEIESLRWKMGAVLLGGWQISKSILHGHW